MGVEELEKSGAKRAGLPAPEDMVEESLPASDPPAWVSLTHLGPPSRGASSGEQ